MKRVPQRAFHGMNYDGTLAGTGLDDFFGRRYRPGRAGPSPGLRGLGPGHGPGTQKKRSSLLPMLEPLPI